jgi:hypothetical protein
MMHPAGWPGLPTHCRISRAQRSPGVLFTPGHGSRASSWILLGTGLMRT